MVDQYQPAQTVLTRPGEFLTGPTRVAINEAGAHFLRSQASVLGVDLQDLFNPIVRNQFVDTHTNTTHTYLQQQVGGLPVMNAVANVSIDRYGRVLTAASSFVNAPDTMPAPTPTLSATQALEAFAAQMGVETPRGMNVTLNGDGIWFPVIISAPDLQAEPIDLKLVYVAQANGNLSLAWHGDIDLPGGENWWEVGMHAQTGDVIFAANYVAHATYNAYPLGFASPYDGGRQLLTDTHNLTASPFGWHDTNGVAGPESTLTIGNNVDAYLDRDNNNVPDTNGRPDGGAGLVFNTPLDLTITPLDTNNQMSAVTNLFYHNNIIHDVTYGHGFNEVSGNFQTNNYGRGGIGNDPVNAEAQDGGGTNNANFATPADGSRPRMQMYIWTNSTPNRDGDLDQQIIYHEYGHGISNRLTGGAANSSALTNFQSRGMGEGWSDFFGVIMTMKSTDVATTPRPMSPWALGQPPTGNGIRTYPYTTNFAVNPFTAASQNNAGGSVHYAGSVWMTALWEVTWELVNAHGWDSSLYGGYQPGRGGNTLMMQLVIDGMKLQPVNPRYSDARDAILQADMNLTGGANQSRIWAGFARRGFGLSMNSGTTSAATTITEAFDIPTTYMVVNSPATTLVGTAMNAAIFVFNNNIDPSSFSVIDDVQSFTNPSNQDIKNQITGHSFPAPNTLKIDFNTQNALGTYKMKIGPNILNAVTGQPMDQNLNGTGGEPGDAFEANLIIDPFKGPDLQGYKAGNAKYENIDLVSGQPGVTAFLTNNDNTAATLSLGSNSFRFYGTTYTTLFFNPNGLITFGTSSTSASNGNMSSTPSQAAIAPMWDDWTTTTTANSMVLTRFEDLDNNGTPDRLIIEWSDVYRVGQTTSPVTFQGILQLNTGTTNGNITFNYVDLDTGNAASAFGVNASNGIKASGTQSTTVPSNRLLLSQDGNDARWLGEGRAYRLGMDVHIPACLLYTSPSPRDRG
jgi:extracellular elastinolytic metalloproteinase